MVVNTAYRMLSPSGAWLKHYPSDPANDLLFANSPSGSSLAFNDGDHNEPNNALVKRGATDSDVTIEWAAHDALQFIVCEYTG